MLLADSNFRDTLKRKIVQIDLFNNLINFFNSISDTKNFGFNPSLVQSVCSGKRKSHKNFKWINDIDDQISDYLIDIYGLYSDSE
jgi:hypothetical protein